MGSDDESPIEDASASRPARRVAAALLRYRDGLSSTGLAFGGLFFALSLAPSLIPRAAEIQGALTGVSAVLGYGLGALLGWLRRFLEIPVPDRAAPWIRWAGAVGVGLFVVTSLWVATDRQDALRTFLGLDPLGGVFAPIVLAISLPLAFGIRELSRGFGWLVRQIAQRLDRVLPRRVSFLASSVVAAWLIANLFSGTVGSRMIQAMDSSFLALDELIEDDVPPPEAGVTGGAGSLLTWEKLGRQGRRFVVGGPSQTELARFAPDARRPIRVYVGLGAADSPKQRAALALEEMKRVGAFDRSVLVVATPTGTGWVDEAAVDSLEYLHGGDTAIVALQYSYLTSYVSIFVEPGFAMASASALFDAVYAHWRTLPRDSRPRFYLQGLSLGSYGSEQSMNLYRVLADPIQGAVWSGPPFSNPNHAFFTRDREPGSPQWLPRFGDDSLVRFSNQETPPGPSDAAWGPIRLVYLQYASDPITFFSDDLFIREPAWLSGERGPDVYPGLRWVPIVTALQVAFDMMGASSLGHGLGHLYAAEDYVDAWLAVTEPEGWSPGTLGALRAHLSERERRP